MCFLFKWCLEPRAVCLLQGLGWGNLAIEPNITRMCVNDSIVNWVFFDLTWLVIDIYKGLFLMMHSSHISVIRSVRVSRSHTGVCVVQAKWSHCTILSQIFLSDLTVKVDTRQSEIHTANKSGCPLVNGEWSLDICYWCGNMWRSCRNLALWA